MAEKIGFVGVGRMGANMARRLKEVGYPIAAVYDINTAAAQALAQELGSEAAEQLKHVTKLSDVIITVVTDDKAMKKIYNGGLLSRSKGKLFINCATITPEVHAWVEAKAEKAGAQSLEACMASSITQAREGSLYLMCGGKAEAFERAKPILEKLSASMRYVGPAGKAAQVKALVNMVMNINTAGLAEGLGLGDALGLDLTVLRAPDRWRRYAEPRAFLFLFGGPRGKRFGHRAQVGQSARPEPAAGRGHQKAVRSHGRGRPRRIG